MADFRPFRGYRPKVELVEKIASPPYDVLSSKEAASLASDNPYSFLHVNKPEIDLPEGTDIHSPAVYEKGRENLLKMINSEMLIRDISPSYYVYQQKMGDHVQVGVMAAASIDEYEADLIKKHEHTRKDKEDDRTRHIDTLNANTGPVFLTYKANSAIDALVEEIRNTRPYYDFTADDGIGHTMWVVGNDGYVEKLQKAFSDVPCMYVADGHHRSASAARVRSLRKEANPDHTGEEGYNFFLSVAFPDNQLQILDYNRVVTGLHKHTPDEFIALCSVRFFIAPTGKPKPENPREFGMYIGQKWYRLTAKPDTFPADDPVASLDVSILSENILSKILDIKDLRTDDRIDFVGGIRGMMELERRVDKEGCTVAFSMYPTTVAQLMAIADAGMIMPPKSTWFEPKLRSGIVVHTLDE